MKANKKKSVANSNKKVSRVTLAKHQDISIISNLHGRLKKCANRQVGVDLNTENVESVDASTLQLLLSFVRQVRSDGNNVNWQSSSPALLDSARLIGMEDELFLSQKVE